MRMRLLMVTDSRVYDEEKLYFTHPTPKKLFQIFKNSIKFDQFNSI